MTLAERVTELERLSEAQAELTTALVQVASSLMTIALAHRRKVGELERQIRLTNDSQARALESIGWRN